MIFQFATQFIQLFLGIYLARKLDETAYGVLGVLGIFWAISQVFIQGGFAAALLQRKEITQTDLSTVFYYNLVMSLIFTAGMIFAAPWIADFFHRPILKETIVVSAWNLTINAVGAVPRVILGRKLKQGVQTMAHLFALMFSGVVAVVLATKGYGVWTFVWQIFVSGVISTAFVWVYAGWTPSFVFSFRSLMSFFGFSVNIMAVGLLNAVFGHLRKFFIGKFYPIEALGYYEQARRYAAIWPDSIEHSLNRVLFPAFAKLQDDIPRLRAAFRRSLRTASFATVFPGYLLCALCVPFIHLVITDRWLPCVPLWRLITGVLMFYPIHELNLQLLKARGYSNLYLRLNVIKKGLVICSIVVLYYLGIIPMLYFAILSSMICLFINTYYTAKDLDYGIVKQLDDVCVYAGLAFVASFCAWLFYHAFWELSCTPFVALALTKIGVFLLQWFSFLGGAAFGVIVYFLLNYYFCTSAFIDLFGIVSEKAPFLRRWIKLREKPLFVLRSKERETK